MNTIISDLIAQRLQDVTRLCDGLRQETSPGKIRESCRQINLACNEIDGWCKSLHGNQAYYQKQIGELRRAAAALAQKCHEDEHPDSFWTAWDNFLRWLFRGKVPLLLESKAAREKRLEEEQRRHEEQARRKAEEQRRREEQARRRAEEQRQREEQARRKAEEQRQREEQARRRAEEQRRQQEQAHRRAEEQRQREEQARRKAEEQRRQQEQAKQQPQTANTYYAAFGLTWETLTEANLKKAWRRMSLRYHPDVNPSPEAAKKFAEISKIHDYLKAELRRKNHNMKKSA